MGLWPFGGKKKKASTPQQPRRGRKSNAVKAAESDAARKARIAEAKVELELLELDQKRAQLQAAFTTGKMTVEEYVAMRERLKIAGFADDTNDPEKLLRGLAQLAPAAPQIGEGLAKIILAARNAVSPPAPSSAPAPQTAASSPTQATQQQESPPEEKPMPDPSTLRANPTPAGLSGDVAMLVGMLSGKSPADAAKFLVEVARLDAGAKDLIGQIVAAADDQLMAVFREAGPEWAGVVAWLEPQQPWLVATAREIRALMAV